MLKYVFELNYPGTVISYPVQEVEHDVNTLVSSLESALADAAIALSLFENSWSVKNPEPSPEEIFRGRSRVTEIRQEVTAKIGSDDIDSILLETNKRIARERWDLGYWPESYLRRLVFLYARSYLYSLNRLHKCIVALTGIDQAPSSLTDLLVELEEAIPDLHEVRNSVAHFEERARGLRHGKPIELEPILNRFIDAPGGNVLVSECLNGNVFSTTMADGHVGEVEVSSRVLLLVTSCVQKVIESFSWKGPPRHAPY